jgi:hypothetical protein
MVLNEVHVQTHLLLVFNVKAQGEGRKREKTGREITRGESESLRVTTGSEKQVRNFVQQTKRLLYEFRKVVRVKSGPLLGYYAASSGNFLPTFRDDLSHLVKNPKNQGSRIQKIFGFLNLEDETL